MSEGVLSRFRQRLTERIGASRFKTWFANDVDLQVEGDELILTAPNEFAARFIHTNYRDDLLEVARELMNHELVVRVRTRPACPNGNGHARSDPPPAQRAPAPARKPPPRMRLRDLDSFVVGPCNQLAFSVARRIAEAPDQGVRLLLVHGSCGVGKTHLLQGVCSFAAREHPTLEWRYVSTEEFTNDYIRAVKCGTVEHFRARFRSVDLLAIDDLHFLANKKATQEEFLHTFDAIHAYGKTVVLSSDRHPREILSLADPLVSRVLSGMVVRIDPPDPATRREILRRRAAALGHTLPEDVLNYVSSLCTRSVRELEGALSSLVALSGLNHEPITMQLARQALGPRQLEPRRMPETSEIARLTAAHFGVTREQIDSKSRDRTVALARAVAMHLARKHTNYSYPELGRMMGQKGHSTVLTADKKIHALLQQNAVVRWRGADGTQHEQPLRAIVEELERQLPPRV